ncbi:Uncharacterized conserved protein, DUF58 family, contains vWF domain [Sphingomonas gellani]|uniref:Uncharacterized conserved protein, DUF58 family, contains vWF domain n=1 Tax=Sphingomonas gellani TaxID=1166340 RepID=A0A1H8EZM5_9SPHN|nr:DUF58 domain-containing protein [Sphingomonas gellani]SEN25051.1 Uncharacterized conserved protein, DUF58 family, contains vWF domain [Sphingomonas gellani]
MIYPTRLAVLATAAGAPVALLVAVAMPDRWPLGLAWPLCLVALTLADGLVGGRRGRLTLTLPATVGVGEELIATARVEVDGSQLPRSAEVAVATDPLLTPDNDVTTVALKDGRGAAAIVLHATRRGHARVETAWLRWRGPLRLAWRQTIVAAPAETLILPDMRPVRDKGAQLVERHAIEGLLSQAKRGDGTEFEALVEFQAGMERRTIDWKQSARHRKLYARDVRVERNNQIVFAVDAGRQMADPVAGLPRIDRAVSAMLLAAWVALKLGDRVALHAFDSQPRIASGAIGGTGAFAHLRRLAARIDYSEDETNYTFALTTLAARLHRRSTVVLFTEIVDLTSADFMIRAAQLIVARHLLIVVVLQDEELESIVAAEPAEADDVARAVTAAELLRARQTVLLRLQRMGVQVVEAEHDRVGERLVQRYVELKRRNML